jgi:hypothetical protein
MVADLSCLLCDAFFKKQERVAMEFPRALREYVAGAGCARALSYGRASGGKSAGRRDPPTMNISTSGRHLSALRAADDRPEGGARITAKGGAGTVSSFLWLG